MWELCAQEESLQAMLVGKYEGKALGCIELDGNRLPNRGGLPLLNGWGSFDKVGKSHRRREFHLLMLRLLRTEAVARRFDHPTIETQATWGKQMMTINQVGMQALDRTIRELMGQQRTHVQPRPENPNPLRETDPIRV